MRLLIVGPRIDEIKRIRNFSGVWAHYLQREFAKRGIECRYEKQAQSPNPAWHYRDMDVSNIDHVLALGLAYLDRLPAECVTSLKRRVLGMVTQTHDRPSPKSAADMTFGIRTAKADRYCGIGWASDPELCSPRQTPGRYQILIDHPDYARHKTDRTAEIIRSALAFAKSGQAGRPVDVFCLGDDGAYSCRSTNPVPYVRANRIPYATMCAAYSRADVFMVTHPESVGLASLECATAGALIVAPKTFIADELLATIRHVSYEGSIPWGKVLAALDIQESRRVAMLNDWGAVTDKIMRHLC